MSEYSEKCKRTPTAEGVVPCFMCVGECVGDPRDAEHNDQLCKDWAARVDAGMYDKEPVVHNPIRYEYRALDIQTNKWRGPGWYFSDETWSELHGPYESVWATKVALTGYLFHLDFGPFSWRVAWKNLGAMWRTARWVASLPDPTKPDPEEWTI